MSARLSRAAMAVASACFGERNREWAQAMEIELEAAIEDGNGIGFSLGCLVASWRELPARTEGRLLLARYALALGLILPLAAFLSSAALLGFPQLDLGPALAGSPAQAAGQVPILNDGNRTAAPVITFLVLLIAASQLVLAWFLVDCDWRRMGNAGSFAAAVAVTLAIFAALAGFGAAPLRLPIAGLILALATIFALAALHARDPEGAT
jgi:hypothetical protein